ncbi:hypothetical protein SLEP1_g47907 [Rubroshorea leprosula]|uniref:DUF7745 domain-containing protein n=1 Tax=Rubroshorea leprosula TaxID=152421 RepID=A0AAV5LS11_9ROSI|nr:hypothetical protein SLEP1_g47907 [Rubroshorea leprosula]
MDSLEKKNGKGKRMNLELECPPLSKKNKSHKDGFSVQTKRPCVKDLVAAWNSLSNLDKVRFDKKFGRIADVLQVEPDWEIIRASLRFYVPHLRCFVFPEFELIGPKKNYPRVRSPIRTRALARKMVDEANLEKVALENRVENMENTLKELMASFQSLQATLVTRAPLTTNPLFEGNVPVANFPMATSTLTLGKEPMSSGPPDPIIGGTSGTKPFVLNAGVATVQSNDQEEIPVVRSITEDEDKAIKAKVQLMEETLKSMQGVQTNKPVDISSLCFFPNIQLSHKFKLPEFDKYNGTGCPYAHLTMYCRKMAPYANDEKLMIHYFQDSLTGPANAWFSTIDKTLSREDLQRTEKKSSESFKGFAQRWRELAAQVQPPLTDHELSNLFIKSTKGPYCEKLMTCVNYTFAQLVIVGEQVEDGIKSGIIMDYQAMKSILEQYRKGSSGVSSLKKVGQNQNKENENGTISSVYETYGRNNQPRPRGQFNNSFQAPTYQPTVYSSQPRPIYAFGINHLQQKMRRHFDKLPLSYTEVFQQLVAAGLVTPVPMVPLNPPFPTWYNPQARCEYHSGGVGHDLENCLALKHRIQDLIDAKELQIASEPKVVGPNITKNPLPTHDNSTVNMIEKDFEEGQEVAAIAFINQVSSIPRQPLILKRPTLTVPLKQG